MRIAVQIFSMSLSIACPLKTAKKGGLVSRPRRSASLRYWRSSLVSREDFEGLCALLSAALWLIFSASVMLRSMAAIANGPEVFPSKVTDDELPNYTIVVALYCEASVVEDLVKAIDTLDYPKGKLDVKLVVEQRDVQTFSRLVELRLPGRYEVIVAHVGNAGNQTKPLSE